MSTTDLPQGEIPSSPAVEVPGETLAEKAIREAMESSAGVTLLGKMAAMRSIHRNLKSEDEAVARNVETHERALWGDEMADAPEAAGGEEMEVMAGRDVHIHHHSPTNEAPKETPQPAVTPTPAPVVQPIAEKPAAGMSTLAKIATGAALVGGGALAPLAIGAVADYMKADPAPVVQPATAEEFVVPNWSLSIEK